MTPPTLPAQRPAETSAAAAAVALLVAYFLGISDSTVVMALALVVGLVPAGVTWLVEQRKGSAGLP